MAIELVALGGGIVLCVLFFTYSLLNRETRGAMPLVVLFAGAIAWLLADFLQAVTGSSIPPLGVRLRLLGPDIVVIGIFLFGLEYTGRDHLITRSVLAVLAIKPILTQLLLTSPYRNELAAVSAPENVTVGYDLATTPLFSTYTAYNYLLIVLGLGFLLHMMIRARYGYQRQIIALIVAMLIPFFLNVAVHVGSIPYDPTAASFVVSASLFMYTAFRLRLMDAVPVARRTVLEEMNEMVFLLDENGNIVTVNDTAEELFTTESNLTGEHVTDILGEGIPLETEVDEGERIDISTTVDGERRHLRVNRSLLTDYRGTPLGQLLVCRDVTDRLERERELRQYTELVQTVGDPMYVIDADGRFERVNDAFLEYTGYERDAIVGEHATVVVPEDDFQKGTEVVLDIVESDRKWDTFEMIVVTADGEEILTEAKVTAVSDEHGGVGASVGVLRDIRERKQREQELRRQNERLDQFAAVISHDLRNPLNVAQGRAELAEQTHETEHFDALQHSLERMETMIGDMLEMARAETTVEETQPVALQERAEVAWETAQTNGAELEVLVDWERRIDCNPDLLQSILENLYRNALDHNDPPVRVTVGQVETDRDGFYVEDDGTGIPVDEREGVFEYGNTSSDEGTGLGLAIVQDMVDAHGWEVDVTEGAAGGARFEIHTEPRMESAPGD